MLNDSETESVNGGMTREEYIRMLAAWSKIANAFEGGWSGYHNGGYYRP